MFKIPVSWWGIGYYGLLASFLFFATPWTFWIVMAGFGFELTFLWVMVSIHAFCIFCVFNAVVMGGLAWLFFDPARVWQSAATVLFFFTVSNYLLSRENRTRLSRKDEDHPETVIASVDGENIAKKDVERPLSQRIYDLKNKIYNLKRNRLEAIIQHMLLEKEAGQRQISKEELIDHVLGEGVTVSDDEIARHRQANLKTLEDARGSKAPSEEEVRKFLEEKKKNEKINDFTETLKEKHEVEIFLKKPTLPLTDVDIKGRPSLGSSKAKVVVVEFSDLFCPACRAAHHTVRKIRDAYENRIRWVFKDFPLEAHEGADTAAAAAHCAGEQGKFWQYQDMVFDGEENPNVEKLEKYAESLDLDMKRFNQCLEGEEYADQIQNDIKDGRNAGISAIPTFIVNGRMLSGALSFDDFRKNIEAELSAESVAA